MASKLASAQQCLSVNGLMYKLCTKNVCKDIGRISVRLWDLVGEVEMWTKGEALEPLKTDEITSFIHMVPFC